jgi:hypothetical protein
MPPIDAPLAFERLRPLTLDPHSHPRGQAHLSAASGLVCAHGRAYAIGDDEHHLAVFHDLDSPGALHRVIAGDLPLAKAARKRRKPDFESLLWLPAPSLLLALGSGSRAQRERGFAIALGADGAPRLPAEPFDLAPLYAPLREQLGEINIEGAFVLGDELVLLQRGQGGSASLALHYALADALGLIGGRRAALRPRSMRPFALGAIDGVALAFTDGAALPGGGWVFTAVAEASDNSYADGPCRGSAVGVVAADGRLLWLRRLAGTEKVEGVAAQADAQGIAICMVTDADDPAQASWLLRARL